MANNFFDFNLGNILTILALFLGFIKLRYDIKKNQEEKEERILNKIEDTFKNVWRRFDQHKEETNNKLNVLETKISKEYLKKEICTLTNDNLKHSLESQFNSFKELMGARFSYIEKKIEELSELLKEP